MSISDWSSDVCSSDLAAAVAILVPERVALVGINLGKKAFGDHRADHLGGGAAAQIARQRKCDMSGTLGGCGQDYELGVGELGHRFGSMIGEIGRASWREGVCRYV